MVVYCDCIHTTVNQLFLAHPTASTSPVPAHDPLHSRFAYLLARYLLIIITNTCLEEIKRETLIQSCSTPPPFLP